MASVQVPHAVASFSTRGARPDNQDLEFLGPSTILGRPATVLAVADGMGGLEGGSSAARIAIDTVREYAHGVFSTRTSLTELRSSVVELFQEANRRVHLWGESQDLKGGAGSTLVLCLVAGERYLVAAAGDSRCYYVNDWEARQLTTDHTRVQELIDLGSMTPQSAEQSPYRHQLTSCLGEDGEIRVDLVPPTPHLGVIDEPCVLLLCSDGLHGTVSAEAIFDQLHHAGDLETACRHLASRAFENGSTDNITVAAVEPRRVSRRGARRSVPASLRVVPGEAAPNASTPTAGRVVPWRRVAGLLALLSGTLLLLALWLWGDTAFLSGSWR